METCPIEEGRTVKALVAQLCEKFYEHGWATGTGGGVSIRVGGPSEGRPFRVFVAPSGESNQEQSFSEANKIVLNSSFFFLLRCTERGYVS